MTGPEETDPTPPTLSVVVMGYRDAETIVRAVHSVVEQADDEVEIVVVTSGGDDSAARVRAAFPGLAVVDSPTRLLPGGARNAGIAATAGSVVAFLAADCLAEPGWVANRRRRHAEGHPLVASAVTNHERTSLAAWGFHFAIYGDRLAGRPAGPLAPTDPGAHGCSYSRTALERIGGFDATVEVGEDTLAVEAVGGPVWYEPTVRTGHWGPRSTVAMVRGRYRRGRARGDRFGPVGRWRALPRRWWRGLARVPRAWRAAGADRRWLAASLPWLVLGNVVDLVGQQVGGLRAARGERGERSRP